MSDSLFTKIINQELPANIRYEDDDFIVIDDISPAAPVHVLIIPKKPFETLEEVSKEDISLHAGLLLTARKMAEQLGISENYKLFMNIGKVVQAVHHIHLHLLGGWDKSTTREELDASSHKLHNSGPMPTPKQTQTT